MAWLILFLAGLCEIAWAVGLKKYGLAWNLGSAATVLMLIVSFYLLQVAMKTLPLGTAYAVWTGIGAVGAAAVGIVWFKEPAQAGRLVCIGLIVIGILGLKWLAPAPAVQSVP